MNLLNFAARLALLLPLTACQPRESSSPDPPRGEARGPIVTAPSAAADSGALETQKQGGPLSRLVAGGPRVARGRAGMVSSVEAQATRAGVAVLAAGGNAVDAAVATAYALAVTHPSAGNVGGGGFMLVAMRGSAPVAVDFREQAPASLSPARFERVMRQGARGPAASGVPGTVAGLNFAQRRFGRLPLADVLRPAVTLARDGHVVGRREALTLGWSWAAIRNNEALWKALGGGNRPPVAKTVLRRSDLAKTLERIATRGDAGFYSGPTAAAIVDAMEAAGGISAADLEGYHARVLTPIAFDYRGYAAFTMPPPSSGGVAVAQTLLTLERLAADSPPGSSAAAAHRLIEVWKRAQAQRRFELPGDDAPGLDLRAFVDPSRLLSLSPPIDPSRATPARRVHPLAAQAESESENTTHLAVVDRDGNAVSCTVTLSRGFGALYAVATTGIIMNDSIAAFGRVGKNLARPGARMHSSMAPTLLADETGVVAVLGSPGGDTIPSTIVQVVHNLVDRHLPPDAAVEAPRMHHGLIPDQVRYEARRPPAAALLASLRALGHDVAPRRAPIGDANVVIVVDGVAYGHADMREGGLAAGPVEAPHLGTPTERGPARRER